MSSAADILADQLAEAQEQAQGATERAERLEAEGHQLRERLRLYESSLRWFRSAAIAMARAGFSFDDKKPSVYGMCRKDENDGSINVQLEEGHRSEHYTPRAYIEREVRRYRSAGQKNVFLGIRIMGVWLPVYEDYVQEQIDKAPVDGSKDPKAFALAREICQTAAGLLREARPQVVDGENDQPPEVLLQDLAVEVLNLADVWKEIDSSY